MKDYFFLVTTNFDVEEIEEENNSEEEFSSDENEHLYEEEYVDEGEHESDLLDEDYDEAKDHFKHISDIDVSAQAKKGLSIRNQIHIWENLLEMRIQLQKCLVAANKMPPNDNYKKIKEKMGKDFSKKVLETKVCLGNLLDKLLFLQTLVQKKFPETNNLCKNEEQQCEEFENEEIPSDSDQEEICNEKTTVSYDEIPVKRRKLIGYEKEISENFKLYKSFRNSVIQKWHEKTQLTVLKSNTVSQSIVDHIEHILSDRAKFVRRTQMRRSDYKILGQDAEDENSENDGTKSRIAQMYNTEIFDDDDFYHQLLRELIEMKSESMTDPVQLGRQWVQLQNFRSKLKRKIDTKATKGRKIRYTVHAKLVNFMAPIDENNWNDEAINELYSSLFGKKQISSF